MARERSLAEIFTRGSPSADEQAPVERRGTLLPLGRTTEGDLTLAVPGALTEAADDIRSLMDQTATRRARDVDPGTSLLVGADLAAPGVASAARRGGSSVGVFGGRRAQRAPQRRLEQAKRLRASGASDELVTRETGWSIGPERKWKFEISDREARLMQPPKMERPARLSEVMVHPKLYQHYPDIGEVRVGVNPDIPPNSSFWAPRWGSHPETIQLGTNVVKSGENAKSALLHETQHAIQHREGFAIGGSSAKEQVMRDLISIRKGASKTGNEALVGRTNDRIRLFMGMSDKQQQQVAMKFYTRLAGEVEARNVERRQHITSTERRGTSPRRTEDVPHGLQEVVVNSTDIAFAIAGLPRRRRSASAPRDLPEPIPEGAL